MALVLVSSAACGFPSIDGEVVTRGRHLTLHADPALPVCASTIADADTFLELAVAYLGAAPAPDVDYFLHDGHPDGCRLFDDGPVACTHYETIHTSSWIHHHELVHTVIRDWGRPPAFLLEGLAEGLGSRYPQLTLEDRATAELPLESTAFFAGPDVGRNYQVAADFVVYLLRRFGPEVYHRLARELGYLSDELTTRLVFRDIAGVSLEDVIADWRSTPPSLAHDLPLDLVGCAAAVIDPGAPESWLATEPAECKIGASARGTVLDQPVHHTIDVPREGLYVAHVGGAEPGTSTELSISDCVHHDAQLAIVASPTNQAFELGVLGSGRHALEVRASRTGVAVGGVVDWGVAGLGVQSATCEGAPAFTAPSGPWVLTFASERTRWPTGATGPESWVRLDLPPEDTTLSLAVFGLEPGATICSGSCDALASCVPVAESFTPISGQPVYLDLRSAGAGGVYVTIASGQSTTARRGPATISRSLLPR